MQAIHDRDGTLQWVSQESPSLGPGEVRIKVAATAVNRADLVQRSGKYPPPPGASEVLGLECSGVISEVNVEETRWQVGQEVCALLAGGGYAQEVVVPSGQVMTKPSCLTLMEAAAVPEVFTTAWLNLKREGQLAAGERVLLHAGASGVGTAAIQLCQAWGNEVVVTVGGPEKVNKMLSLGVQTAVDRHLGPWLEASIESGKFDVILDPVGGHYLEANIRALKPKGRLVVIGVMGGRVGNLPLAHLLTKRLQIKGSVLRGRTVEEKADILGAMEPEVWPLFEQKKLAPVIFESFPIEQAEKAHQLLESNQTIGKIVLEVPQ